MKFSEYIGSQADEFMTAGDGYASLGDLSKACIDSAVNRYVSKMMARWEYKVVQFKGTPGTDKEQEMLTKEGLDGWQLCCIYIGVMYYYFKRPITS